MIYEAEYRDTISGRTSNGSLRLPCYFPDWFDLSNLGEDTPAASKPALWIQIVRPIDKGKSTNQATEIVAAPEEVLFVPRTKLGRKLYSIRAKAIAAGMRLLSEEEVLEEVRRRRGEIEYDETDLP